MIRTRLFFSLLLLPLLLTSGCSWYFLDRDPNERPVGKKAPSFDLPAAFGETVSLAELRRKGNVVLVFYRGHW